MEYIDNLFLIANKNQILVFIISIFVTFVESFFPALPLVAIVGTNAIFLGFTRGIIASSIGSCFGTFLLYYLSRRFSNTKFFKRIKNNNIDKISIWIKKQSTVILFICYASFFVPSFLVSISAGISDIDYKNFLCSMIVGKVCLFSIVSYIGNDLDGVLTNPIKIIFILLIFLFMFFVSKNINKSIK